MQSLRTEPSVECYNLPTTMTSWILQIIPSEAMHFEKNCKIVLIRIMLFCWVQQMNPEVAKSDLQENENVSVWRNGVSVLTPATCEIIS